MVFKVSTQPASYRAHTQSIIPCLVLHINLHAVVLVFMHTVFLEMGLLFHSL
jgi:hypothetical protein